MKNKRIYLLLGCLAVVFVSGCGCGKKGTDTGKDQVTMMEVTPTPASNDNKNADGLVKMQQVTPTPTSGKILGARTETASQLSVMNKTGKEITAFYVRLHSDDYYDDQWGENLMTGVFTMKNGEKATYYYEKDAFQGSTCDIRIVYSGDSEDENYFRGLDLTKMKDLTLCLETKNSIPYAEYTDSSTGKKQSTLEEVKVRMGLSDGSTAGQNKNTDGADKNNTTANLTPTPAAVTPTPEPIDPENPGQTQPVPGDVKEIAQSYIGSDISSLFADANVGTANSASYDTDPDLGEIGYYYYDTFTVTTSVDANGNEVVTNIW